MKEKQIPELQGTSILTKGFFNRLIKRIECTKPLAGKGVILTEQENGIEISLTEISLNVCSNGVATAITVYGPLL